MSLNVAILMCTHNGARFLSEQLLSIASQTYEHWTMVVSDDGSSDKTVEILEEFAKSYPNERVELRRGPCQGFAKNFLSLGCDRKIQSQYFAFSDQDDIWLREKLEIGVSMLSVYGHGIPALYCGSTVYIGSDNRVCGASPIFVFPPSFRNALVQNLAGGNTMVFNAAAKRLLEKAGDQDIVAHDWWLYLLVAGAGGVVEYDKVARVNYRQHPGAVIGGNATLTSSVRRVFAIMTGRYKGWVSKNIAALLKSSPILSREASDILKLVVQMRSSKFRDRLRLFNVVGLYRQTWRGTLSLYVSVFLNKF